LVDVTPALNFFTHLGRGANFLKIFEHILSKNLDCLGFLSGKPGTVFALTADFVSQRFPTNVSSNRSDINNKDLSNGYIENTAKYKYCHSKVD